MKSNDESFITQDDKQIVAEIISQHKEFFNNSQIINSIIKRFVEKYPKGEHVSCYNGYPFASNVCVNFMSYYVKDMLFVIGEFLQNRYQICDYWIYSDVIDYLRENKINNIDIFEKLTPDIIDDILKSRCKKAA